MARPPSAGRSSIGGVLLGALAMLVGSAALGLAVNHFSPRGIPIFPPSGQQEGLALPLPAGLLRMNTDQARAAFQAKAALLLDARGPAEYAAGHIPGSLNLPASEFEERYPDLAGQVEGSPGLVVYCQSVECGEAVEVAERLRELVVGKPIHVYEAGWEAWQAAGYPERKGEQP